MEETAPQNWTEYTSTEKHTCTWSRMGGPWWSGSTRSHWRLTNTGSTQASRGPRSKNTESHCLFRENEIQADSCLVRKFGVDSSKEQRGSAHQATFLVLALTFFPLPNRKFQLSGLVALWTAVSYWQWLQFWCWSGEIQTNLIKIQPSQRIYKIMKRRKRLKEKREDMQKIIDEDIFR